MKTVPIQSQSLSDIIHHLRLIFRLSSHSAQPVPTSPLPSPLVTAGEAEDRPGRANVGVTDDPEGYTGWPNKNARSFLAYHFLLVIDRNQIFSPQIEESTLSGTLKFRTNQIRTFDFVRK